MNKHALLLIMACCTVFNAHSKGYGGINLGINTLSIHKDLTYPLDESTPSMASFNNSYTHFHGQILLGYELQLNERFSAALESNVDWFRGSSNYTISNWYFDEGVLAKEQFKYGYSLFLLPLYHYNEAVSFFAGPGFTRSYLNVATNSSAGNVGLSTNFNQWLTGGGLKVGTQTQLNKNIDILFTYQFTQYNSLSRSQVEPLSQSTLQGHYKPSAHLVLVGLKANLPEQVSLTK